MDSLFRSALNFLFVPESQFSIFFLVIFIVLLVYGCVKLRSVSNEVTEFCTAVPDEYAKVRDYYLPDEYIKIIRQRFSGYEAAIDDLPNVFVSVGILGTFIGLGVSVHGAAELLSTDKVDLMQLNAVLSVIAFKFQTSVWGTIFSLIFQRGFLERYVAMREIVFSTALMQLHASDNSPRNTLEKQLQVMNEVNESSQARQTILEKAADNFDRYVEITRNFKEAVDKFAKDSTDSQQNILENMVTVSNRLLEHMDEVSNASLQELQEFGQHIDKMAEQLDLGQNNVSKLQQEMMFKIVRSIETLQKVFIRSENQYVKDTQEDLKKILKNTQEDLQKVLTETLSGNLNNINVAVNDLNVALKGISDVTGSVKEQIVRTQNEITRTQTEFRSDQKKFAQMNMQVFTDLQKSIAQIRAGESKHRDNVQAMYEKINEICVGIANSQDGKLIVEMLENLIKTAKNNNQSLTSAISGVTGAVMADTEISGNTHKLLQETSKAVQDSNRAKQDINKSLQETSKAASAVNYTLGRLSSVVAEENNIIKEMLANLKDSTSRSEDIDQTTALLLKENNEKSKETNDVLLKISDSIAETNKNVMQLLKDEEKEPVGLVGGVKTIVATVKNAVK